jgi:hypothetical protein
MRVLAAAAKQIDRQGMGAISPQELSKLVSGQTQTGLHLSNSRKRGNTAKSWPEMAVGSVE